MFGRKVLFIQVSRFRVRAVYFESDRTSSPCFRCDSFFFSTQSRLLNASRRDLEVRFSTALALASASDLIASVPERHTGNLRAGMHSFALPLAMPEFTVSLLWHPRMHADPAHRWLRGCVRDACADQLRP